MFYILVMKINTLSDSAHLKMAVKKALLLVPVFGVQYFFYIVPFDPFETCSTVLFFTQYLLIVVEALQGAVVTTIFCFFNREVYTTTCLC